MQRFYTGVGSRDIPEAVYAEMVELAGLLARAGWVLRSGGAPGADTAFEEGCLAASGAMEIYLPWRGFNGNSSPLFGTTPEAVALAGKYHRTWEALSDAAKKLHGRNTYQVLGRTLDIPSELVICWTPDGCESHRTRGRPTGGTGTAVSLGEAANLPIFNIRNDASRLRLNDWLTKEGVLCDLRQQPGQLTLL